MKRATFVVSMMLLLASASVAAAECAWVMWREHSHSLVGQLPEPFTWTIKGTYEDRAKCMASRKRLLDWMAQTYRDAGRTVKLGEEWGYDLSATTKDELGPPTGYIFFNHYCLPDTIDPREKKG